VLVPLVTMYFLILYAYTIKIVVTLDWPEGQLAWMILGFSFLGVLTYLALFPLREKENWIRYFGTGLYMAMIPQTGMLFWALSFRLRDYGITENRYFVLVFGIWLLLTAIYYLVARVKDIRLIPISLFVLAVLTSFGPWGAFGVAERSQANRLEGILVENGLLQDGLYVQSSNEISDEDVVEINEIVRYLGSNHGFDAIEPWFGGEDLDTISDNQWERNETIITEKFGLEVVYSYHSMMLSDRNKAFSLYVDFSEDGPLEIGGYEYFVNVSYAEYRSGFENVNDTYILDLSEDHTTLQLLVDGEMLTTFDLKPVIEFAETNQRGTISRDNAIVTSEEGDMKFMLSIESFYGEFDDDEVEIHSLEGILFFSE